MKAVVWHGKRDVRVDTVPDPILKEPTDVIVRVTSSGICGSDLHLYELFGPFLDEGDILGHEPMGIVAEVGSAVTEVRPGDRVVVPFNISCGACFMCGQGLQSQCETTQVREQGMGASLFGYTKLYGQVPGGQAEYLRVAVRQHAADQGSGRAAGRPVRLPVRRAAHGVAGSGVRRHSGRRQRRGADGLLPPGPGREPQGRRAGQGSLAAPADFGDGVGMGVRTSQPFPVDVHRAIHNGRRLRPGRRCGGVRRHGSASGRHPLAGGVRGDRRRAGRALRRAVRRPDTPGAVLPADVHQPGKRELGQMLADAATNLPVTHQADDRWAGPSPDQLKPTATSAVSAGASFE